MEQAGQSDISPGRIWLGLTGIRYQVTGIGADGRVELVSIDPEVEVTLAGTPDALRKTFKLVGQ